MVTYKPVSGSIQFIHVKRATIKQPITVDIRKEPYSNLFINRGQTNFGRTTTFNLHKSPLGKTRRVCCLAAGVENGARVAKCIQQLRVKNRIGQPVAGGYSRQNHSMQKAIFAIMAFRRRKISSVTFFAFDFYTNPVLIGASRTVETPVSGLRKGRKNCTVNNQYRKETTGFPRVPI